MDQYREFHNLMEGDVHSSVFNLFRLNKKYYVYDKYSSKYIAVIRNNWWNNKTSHYFIER